MYGQFPKSTEIKANFKELEALYKASLKEVLKFLPTGARVVLCLPAYKKDRVNYERFENLDFMTNVGYNLVDLISPALVKSFPFVKLTDRSTAIYDRKDQIVAREIVILEHAETFELE